MPYYSRPMSVESPFRPDCPLCGTAMSILRYEAMVGPDNVAYHCRHHGRFWPKDGHLRHEEEDPRQFKRSSMLNPLVIIRFTHRVLRVVE